MKRLRVYLLGGFRATVDDQPITAFEADSARALLAYLALNTAYPHRREHLAHLLWGDQPREHGLVNLRAALTRLRHALADHATAPAFVLAGRQDIQLNPQASVWVDVCEIELLLDQVKRHPHRRLLSCPWCLAHLTQIADLYCGELCSDLLVDSLPFQEWQTARREWLHYLVIQVLATLAEHYHAWGAYTDAERFVRRELALDPWNEGAHQQLMRTLSESGQRSAALAQYQACRTFLRDELGVEPSEETIALYHEICTAPRPKRTRSPLAFLHSREALQVQTARFPNNLPLPTTAFFGRQAEIDLLLERMVNPINRLTTLVGAGGTGKTRLALAVAQQLLGSFAHGVWFVPLADLVPATDARQIQSDIASHTALALGLCVAERADLMEQLLNYLRGKELLLVFDNFEHLLAGAGLIQELLQTTPGLALLVTSRQPLHFRSEYVHRLVGLPVAESAHDAQAYTSSAVQLFVERANRSRAGFTLTPGNLPTVLSICRLVQGLPLGIELAVAWLSPWSLDHILERMQEHLNQLGTTQHDVPARHRSLWAVLEGSWALLSGDEQRVLAALSAFRGGCTAAAAQAIAGAQLDTLARLIDQSLLQHDVISARYELHELLRQFAEEKLAAWEAGRSSIGHRAPLSVAARHSAYYVQWIHELEPTLYGHDPLRAITLVQAELGNIQLAWLWAAGRANVGMLASSLPGLARFYELIGLRANAHIVFAQAADTLLAMPEPLSAQAQALLSQLLVEEAKTQLALELGSLNRRKTAEPESSPGDLVAHENLAIAHIDGHTRHVLRLLTGL